MGNQLIPITKSSNHQREPARVPFSFTLDGANDPSVFTANILAVQRLETAGATVFFRITFREPWTHNSANASVTGLVKTTSETRHAVQCGQYTDAGGDTFDSARDLDVIVFADGGAGADTSVDTAGIVVGGELAVDRWVV